MTRHITRMTIEDAEHYTPAQRQAIIASYPKHERDARAKGIPTLGSGRVFPISEDEITIAPFAIPKHWAVLGAIDFGWDHPTAAVKLAWDRDADIIYVTTAHRLREATPVIHAAAIRPWGPELPWVWPHDGLQHDKGSGKQLAQQYRDQGLKFHHENVTFEDGSNGVEAGVIEMLERMETGRLKVFSNLTEWFDEFRLYHRKKGLIIKERDDLISATRYGMMGIRFACVPGPMKRPDGPKTTSRGPGRNGGNGWMGG